MADPQKWEYRLQSVSLVRAEEDEGKLNKLGSEGWELVTAVADVRAAYSNCYAYFKRPLP